MKTLAELINEKTGFRLRDYCRERGIGYEGLSCGYVSMKNARVLDGDGIDWRSARNIKVAGGGCGKFKVLNATKEGENG